MKMQRRNILKAIGAAGAAGVAAGIPGLSLAQEKTLAATTFPGAWEESHRAILLPAFRKATGVQANLVASLAVDTVAKINASRAAPPFDVVLLDEGPYLATRGEGIYEKMPVDKIPNLKDLPPKFIDPTGQGAFVSAQIYGIAYNTERIKTPPTSWNDMLKPEFKGRIGLVSMGSTLGSAWMAELARINGGSEENMEPAFEFIKKLLPNVGAVAANPGVLATLFQQGQIDFSVHYINNIEALRAKGVPVALARPESNWGLVRSTMHIVKNTKSPDLAAAYINEALSLEVQQKMSEAPYFVAPTNKNAKFTGALAAIAKDMSELEAFRQTDWIKLNPRRAEYIDRFNREVKV